MCSKARTASGFLGMVLLSLLGPGAAGAQTAVPRWRQSYQPSGVGTTDATIIAARELVDGTRLAVSDQLVAFHFDANGNALASVRLPNPGENPKSAKRGPGPAAAPGATDRPEGNYDLGAFAAIDPFGGVVLSRPSRLLYYESSSIETMKYDGLTGRPLWAEPAITDVAGLNGDEFPAGVFLDDRGDVYVTGFSESSFYTHLTFKYHGTTGEPVWGPTMIAGVQAPGAAAIAANYSSVLIAFAKPSSGSDNRSRIAAYRISTASGAILTGPSVVDGEGSEYPTVCVAGPGGTFFVAGESDELFTVRRYDYTGDVLWTSRFDPLPGNGESEATSLAIDAAGDVLVTGIAGPRYATYKLSGQSGGALWGPELADSGSNPQAPAIDVFGNGDALVATIRVTGLNSYFQFTRYRRADGHPVFGPTQVGEGSVTTYLTRRPFFIASNGRIFAVASFQDGPPFTRAFEVDGLTAAMVWGPEPLTLPFQALSYLVDLGGGPDGSVAVTGYDASNLATLTFKYDRATGNTIWGPVSYTGAGASFPYQALADAAGNVFVVGSTDEFPGGAVVIKYASANGAVVWGPTILQDVQPLRMVLDAAGNALVTGWTYSASFTYVARTARISGNDGAIDWDVNYDTGQQGDIARALAVDGDGNAILVGDTTDNNYVYSWFAVKYAAANGSVMWGPWNGPAGSPLAAATDAAGDVFVTGGAASPSSEMTTFKLASADGEVLWGPELVEGTGDYVDSGTALAVDPDGDVFIGGYLYNLGTSYDMVTVKYRGSDGAVLWGPVLFDGDAHGSDYVYTLGMGIDTSGNVVVGGTSDRGSSGDAVLLKYEADTGNTLWGPVYAGGSGYDQLYGFSAFGDSVAIGLLNYREILSLGYDESFGMTSLEGELPPASCGGFMTQAFGAANGVLPYQWSISSGALPPGVNLSPTGILSGVSSAEGDYAFTVRAEDGSSAVVDRPMTLHIGPGVDPFGAIYFSGFEDCAYTLHAPNVAASYLWLPGGETTAEITVLPGETTVYGLLVSDGSCNYRYSVTVPALALQDPDCLAPLVESLSPASGPAAGGTPLTLTGLNFQPGTEVWIGGAQATGASTPDPTQITATSPSLTPGAFYPAVVVNPDTGSAALPNAWFADFLDVGAGNPFHDDIVKLVRHGVTAGCGGGNYCPASPVTRQQMAVFLLRSKYGAAYVPPPAVGVFADVPPEDPFAPWIEKLHDLGVTSGCGGDNYCPASPVTRAQMAVFLLKTLNGASWPPPGPFGWFADVPSTNPFAAWIDTLYWYGISGGCNPDPLLYCPGSSVNRGQMSAFLVRTFQLP
jgi:IPT/TIG domain/Putative Ig domain/S-layer homology domain